MERVEINAHRHTPCNINYVPKGKQGFEESFTPYFEGEAMRRLLRGVSILLAAMAVGGLIDWGPGMSFTGTAQAKPGPKGRGDKGPKKGKDHLPKAYEALTDVTAWTEGGRARPPRDLAPLIDRAKDLYRSAVKSAREEDLGRADELAAAAHDAARGLVHALRADAPAAKGVPLPPLRDDDELDDLLRRTRDRLEGSAEFARGGAGREFYDAARRFYDRANRAGREDSARAMQLARAAEAWAHVGEHLTQAEEGTGLRREPGRRDERRPPPPPPDDGPRRPPPPPRD